MSYSGVRIVHRTGVRTQASESFTEWDAWAVQRQTYCCIPGQALLQLPVGRHSFVPCRRG